MRILTQARRNTRHSLLLIGLLAVQLPFAAPAQSDRPSWRTVEDTPSRPELPPEVDRPDFSFEVDRDALFAQPTIRAQDAAQAPVASGRPELGRVATWRERRAARAAEPESVAEPQTAPAAEATPEEVAPPTREIAALSGPKSPSDTDRSDAPQRPQAAPPARDEAAPAEFDLKPVRTATPDYPRAALLDGTEGWVDVEFTVAPDGTVRDARVIEAQPRRVFDRAALKAASNWRFEAPQATGVTIEQQGVYRFTFRMDG